MSIITTLKARFSANVVELAAAEIECVAQAIGVETTAVQAHGGGLPLSFMLQGAGPDRVELPAAEILCYALPVIVEVSDNSQIKLPRAELVMSGTAPTIEIGYNEERLAEEIILAYFALKGSGNETTAL